MTTEQQQKTVILAEKLLQRTCKTHFDDVILKDENGHAVIWFDPYNNWNDTHMVLDKVMENYRLFWHLMDSIDAANFGTLKQDVKVLAKATKQELMDEVYNLLTNS